MPSSQNSSPGKHSDPSAKLVDIATATINKTAENNERASSEARATVDSMVDWREQATESGKQALRTGVQTFSHHARLANDRVARVLGFSGEDGNHLAAQSKQNMAAVTRCGTVLTQAFQDVSRNWFELVRKQWERNLQGLNRLTHCKSVQEFATIQSDLVREGVDQIVQDSRTIAERSLRGVTEAGETFGNFSNAASSSSIARPAV